MSLRFDHPQLLWLLLLAVPVVALGWWGMGALEPLRRWTSVALRVLVVALLALILAGPHLVRHQENITLIALLDDSESVRRFADFRRPPESRPPGTPGSPGTVASPEEAGVQQWFQHYINAGARGRRIDDYFGVVTFDGRPAVRLLPAPTTIFDPASADQPNEGTDLAQAIRLGMAMPADGAKRLLLASDGNPTAPLEDLMAAAREAKAAGIPIDVLPIDYQLTREVMVEGVFAPIEARREQSVSIRIVLSATHAASGRIILRHDGVPVILDGTSPDGSKAINPSDWSESPARGPDGAPARGRYTCAIIPDLEMKDAGASRFEAIFEPAPGQDSMPGNNRAEAFTLVQGKGKVLLVDNMGPGAPGSPGSGDILPTALQSRGIELDRIADVALPTTLAGMLQYDAIVFQNVPAERISPQTQAQLARYVNDLGGGFIMIGGPDSFGAGGWTNTAIDQILPVSCQIPSQSILPSGALVLVLDRSGSMSSPVTGSMYTQQEIANEAAVQALQTLYPQDMVGVVAFDESAKWVHHLALNHNPAGVAKAIRSIQPGGGTNIYAGLEAAFDELGPLQAGDAAVKHVILLTDGNDQPGGQYFRIVGKMVNAGISITTIGIGDGQNSQLLNDLAKMGNGNFHSISDPKRLPQVFIKEVRTIRKSLIKEKDFVPQLVQTGSPITQGITATPKLRGLVMTGPKGDPRVLMPMLGPEGEPLFAHWQVGLGRAAAFTSDATNRWAVDWLTWGGYADFWARMVRTIARPSASKAFDLATVIKGDKLHIRLDATGMGDGGTSGSGAGNASGGGSGGFGNFMSVAGTVIGPDGTAQRVTLQQTGPGVYEAQLPATASGNYIVSLFAKGAGGTGGTGGTGGAGGDAAQVIFGGASRAQSPELRTFTSNRALMEEIAHITGGRILDPGNPQDARLFDHALVTPSSSMRPLWRTLLVWMLILFMLDVACRRIAWDLVAMKEWALGRGDAFLGLFKAREVQGEQTLAALKRRSKETDRQLAAVSGHAAPAAPPPAGPVEPPAATAKFEAQPQFEASEDFAAAVGAARAEDDRPKTTAGAGGGAASPQDPKTTSRLLDAKRRTKERMSKDG